MIRRAPLLLSLWVTACASGGTVEPDGSAKSGGAAGASGSSAGTAGAGAGGASGGAGDSGGAGAAGAPSGGSSGSGGGAGAAGGGGTTGGSAGTSGGSAGVGGVAGTSGSGGKGGAGSGGKAQALPHVCDDDLENGDIALECPEGSVIGGVTFAAFGTPTGSCGTFHTGPCDAPNAKAVVLALCGGKTKCGFQATSALFGDPCSGTMKNARIEVECVACGFGVTQLCGPKCTTVMSDPENCGKCGEACDLGVGCQAGSCVCAPSECHQSCVMRGFGFGNCTLGTCTCGG